MNSAMIDLETLGTRFDSAVISIGVAVFNEDQVIESTGWGIRAEDWHGHINPATVRWWAQQGPEAAQFSFTGQHTAFTAAFELKTFLAKYDAQEFWANSPQFDMVILQSWWERLGSHVGEFPIHYRLPRDMRTIVAEAERLGHDPKAHSGTYVAHNPIDDAVSQSRIVIAARKMIGGRL